MVRADQFGGRGRNVVIHQAKTEHEVAYQDLCQLVSRHADELTQLDILAIAANMVGKLIALQDQRTLSPSEAMEIVIKNIERGNQQVIEHIERTEGSA
jgi:F420-0:gamma-glutamyl ligase